jgi:hypothetical protein
VNKLIGLGQISLVAIFLSSCSAWPQRLGTVYYMQFDIETYAPVSTRDIKKLASQEWILKSERQESDLVRILERGAPAIFNNNVRVLLIMPGTKIYIDDSGVASSDLIHGIQIDRADFARFGRGLPAQQRRLMRPRADPEIR